jgi:hypothetical protein
MKTLTTFLILLAITACGKNGAIKVETSSQIVESQTHVFEKEEEEDNAEIKEQSQRYETVAIVDSSNQENIETSPITLTDAIVTETKEGITIEGRNSEDNLVREEISLRGYEDSTSSTQGDSEIKNESLNSSGCITNSTALVVSIESQESAGDVKVVSCENKEQL